MVTFTYGHGLGSLGEDSEAEGNARAACCTKGLMVYYQKSTLCQIDYNKTFFLFHVNFSYAVGMLALMMSRLKIYLEQDTINLTEHLLLNGLERNTIGNFLCVFTGKSIKQTLILKPSGETKWKQMMSSIFGVN